MNARSFAVFAIVILAVVGTALWFLQSAPPPAVPDAIRATPVEKMVRGVPTPTAQFVATTIAPDTTPQVAKPEIVPTEIPEWETKIDEIIRSNPDNSEAGNRAAAQMLVNLLPTLPPDGQSEAAQHITNLIEDKDYNQVLQIVKNPQMPEEVLDVFVTDLMNRDDTVKLPTLLAIAKIPNHPHQEEAKTDLEIFLDEDYGADWGKWDAAMKAYLKKQADEAAAEAREAATPQ